MDVKPGYKQTEVGAIPEEWDLKSIGDIAMTVASGRSSVNSEFGDFPVHGSTGTIGLSVKADYSGRAILIARVGANAGKLTVVDGKYGVTDNTIILRVDNAQLWSYVWRQLDAKRLNSMVFGSGQPLITGTQIKHLSIPLPPTKAEQEAIAEALSDADALIESLEGLLAKKRHLKHGAMQQLLTGKKLLPGFDGEWELRPLIEVAPLQRGFDLPNEKLIQGTYPVVYSNGVLNYHASFQVKGPGVVTGRSGTIGNVTFVEQDFWPHNTSLWVTSFKGNDPTFIFYLYTLIGLEQFATGSGVPTLNRNDVHAFKVGIPASKREQTDIAAILSDMDAEIAALDARLVKTRQIKQGVMQELLTGRNSAGMSTIGQPERATQNRVVALFRDELGYRYLGDWADRDGNNNIEDGLLTAWLTKGGYTPAQISVALYKVRIEADNPNRTLYGNNQAVYNLLRYGAPAKIEAGKVTETVQLINWREPERNDFAVAEEVTLKGSHERRPDIVLYVNGIAIGVLELKNSRVSIGDGIRQNLSNQQSEFNAWFFSTIQVIFAGNDSEGLQYGAIGTPEKYFLKWKEDEGDNTRFKLDKYLLKLCEKQRLIELIHDFVLFDGGVKKLPRAHQYFGIKAAQRHVREKKGGIIWHTQGSGKSIVMVLLAKWILENNPNARVGIITDRDELDKQIERVFTETGEPIKRTSSGRDLMNQLGQARPRLLCSLVHKFGRRDVDDFDAFIKELEAQPSRTVGEVFVFVDECHRTQSGKLHRVMKALMPHAVFIGFTGTPLLVRDRATSLEVFGGYIHTYKFSEGVVDGVVLDLIYEARDIDQRLGSEDKIDAWFEAKTKGLNDWQKDELKKKWGTMQNVLSSRSRMERVVTDIIFDFSVKPRLSSERGNAILVASGIYEACKYFSLFQKTPFKGKCAVVTSYNPQARDVTLEDTGANTETDKQFVYNTYTELLKYIEAKPDMSKTETYEERAKALFTKEPANMKLLVVVDKLLTGFDAPPCTYLYVDKSMQDHGLFQAICRTNRLDGEDKDFGYIVDYKALLKKVENATAVYTSELDRSAGGATPEVLLEDRLKKGKERLDTAIETLALLCEPVEPPKGELEHIHYFGGNTEIASDLNEREPQRAALYKATVALVRAYANIADELEQAGYSTADIGRIKHDLAHYLNVREIIRKASGETLDLKAYEADMRHLIDTYIEADEPRTISPFDNMSLLELIVQSGIASAINSRLGKLKGNRDAVAETIENNVRSKIIKEHLSDPDFYEKMSMLLDEIIAARKAKAIEYEEYLKRIANLAKKVEAGKSDDTPKMLDTPGKRALWNNLGQNEALALKIDATVRDVRPDDWRGVQAREHIIKAALYGILQDVAEVERIFPIIKAQREY